jgi:hypothetical protein
MKRQNRYALLALLLALGGCTSMNYSLVAPGVVAVDDLTVQAGTTWNKAPANATPSARKNSTTWTQDGLLLDRLAIIPGVPDGEPLLITRDKSAAVR